MSLGVCLPGLEADGAIDPARAAELRARYDELIAAYVRDGSPETAEALASAQLLKTLDDDLARKRFLAGRTIRTRQRIMADMTRFGGGDGSSTGMIDPRSGPAFLDHSERATYSNVEGRRKAVLGDSMRLLGKIMQDHSANLLGKVRNKAQLQDIVRELFGEASGSDSARAMAGAWRQAAEMLRQRFNAAGGDIGFRSDWGLPQSHNWRAVRLAGFEKWRGSIIDRLDLKRMIDTATGLPIAREKLELLLPRIWDDIRSNGAASRTPGSPPVDPMLANLRSDSRFFVFKSADDWTAYHADFGEGSAYDAMIAHIQGMARDIAALEILGPNPAATIDWMKQVLDHSARIDKTPGSKAVNRARRANLSIDRIWNEYRGANLQPDHEGFALVMSTVRNMNVATKLGGAFLSAASDFSFSQTTRAFNGLKLDAGISTYAKLFRPGSGELQRAAVRRGLIAEEWSNQTAAQARFSLEEQGAAWSQTLASGVLRLSLLNRHTQSMRWAYGLDALADFTDVRINTFAELPDKMRAMMQRYGLSAEDWDKLRSAPTEFDAGAEWIAPHRLDDGELASRFMEMIHEEVDYAVPVADLGARAYMNTMKRGDVLGEIGRSALQFKGFGIAVQLRQWQRIGAQSGASRMRYLAWLIAGTLIGGAVAIQLKALAAGKDLRPTRDPKFVMAAMQQGGGFGIMGDFLFDEHNRTGADIAASLAGPTISDLQQINNAVRSDNPQGQAVKLARDFMPGNNLWFTRVALDRMLADQVNEMVNPEYRQSYRAAERSAARQGTSFWWRPGEMTPGRAPDFANALEEGPE